MISNKLISSGKEMQRRGEKVKKAKKDKQERAFHK